MIQKFINLQKEESGQDLVEYALVLAALVVAIVAGSGSLANLLSTTIDGLNTKISTAIASVAT